MLSADLRSVFNWGIAGTAMLACVAADQPVDDATVLVPSGRVCVAPARIRNPQTPLDHYVRDLYNQTANLNNPLSTVCMDHALDVRNSCGGYRTGSMRAARNILSLNPKNSHARSATTMVHELHHRKQWETGLISRMGENIPPTQRVAMQLILEADARVPEVIFAYNKEKEGHPEYAETLRKSKGAALLLKTYEDRLAENPADIPAAMRAVFIAFTKQGWQKAYYANKAMKSIRENNQVFNTAVESYDLLSDDNLRKLGEIGAHNYMDDDGFRNFIRLELFTDKDYAEMAKPHEAAKCSI